MRGSTTHDTDGLLVDLLEQYHPRDFQIRLWDGIIRQTDSGVDSKFTLIIRNPSILRTMLWQADELSLAEAFISGELEVEGNLEAAIPLADYLSHHTMTWTNRLRLSVNLLSSSAKHSSKAHSLVARVTGASHSLHRDNQAIAHHHDHPAEFDAPGWVNEWCIMCLFFLHR